MVVKRFSGDKEESGLWRCMEVEVERAEGVLNSVCCGKRFILPRLGLALSHNDWVPYQALRCSRVARSCVRGVDLRVDSSLSNHYHIRYISSESKVSFD